MQKLIEDPDCQQFPTAPCLPFSLASLWIYHPEFPPPTPFTAALPWGEHLPRAEMFAQIRLHLRALSVLHENN